MNFLKKIIALATLSVLLYWPGVSYAGSCLCGLATGGEAGGYEEICYPGAAVKSDCESGCVFYESPACTEVTTAPCGDNQICNKSAKRCENDADCIKSAGGLGIAFCKDKFCFFDALAASKSASQPSLLGTQADLQVSKPILEINIPSLKLSEPAAQLDSEGYLHLPWIGEYIIAVYKFSMVVGSILAVIMIIWAGVRITVSGGGENKKIGYKHIGQAVVGLFLLWGSYFILNTVSPDLVNLKTLKVFYVKPVDIVQIVDNGTDNADAATNLPDGADACVKNEELVKITGVNTGGAAAVNPYLQKDAFTALQHANEIAKTRGKEIVVMSATRSKERQQQLWQKALEQYGSEERAKKYVSPPTCSSPHLTGRAIDACLAGTPSCGKMQWANASYSDADVQLLQNIMQEAGWKRYCGEWWHFEYGLNITTKRCSP